VHDRFAMQRRKRAGTGLLPLQRSPQEPNAKRRNQSMEPRQQMRHDHPTLEKQPVTE
jgi:hypothetical protein